MKRVNFLPLPLVAVCLLTAPFALSQGGSVEEKQILGLSDQMIQAQLKADINFFEKHYADDVTIIHSNGKLSTKRQEIADLQSRSVTYEAIETRDRTILVYGDTAVVGFLVFFKGTVNGQPYNGDFRRTVVWVKKGDWKIVLYQITRFVPANQ